MSIIKEAVENIRLSRNVEVDVDAIDISDPATYKLYSDGRTIGTFQFESAGMQKYLRELQPSTFEDLIAMNALYRPGPMDYIPDFIDRKHGRKPIEYDIPVMEKYLKDTYGITVYQEQVMLLSRLLADFTRGESDALRKAMGKKLRDKLDHMKPKFIEVGVRTDTTRKCLRKSGPTGKSLHPMPSTSHMPLAIRGWPIRRLSSRPTIRPNTWRRS